MDSISLNKRSCARFHINIAYSMFECNRIICEIGSVAAISANINRPWWWLGTPNCHDSRGRCMGFRWMSSWSLSRRNILSDWQKRRWVMIDVYFMLIIFLRFRLRDLGVAGTSYLRTVDLGSALSGVSSSSLSNWRKSISFKKIVWKPQITHLCQWCRICKQAQSYCMRLLISVRDQFVAFGISKKCANCVT